MSLDFEELDFQKTPLGDLTLRRRRMRSLDNLQVYEVILGTGYLMSSLFTTVEIALADLGLAKHDASELDVVVGGLGLGYTAQAALKDDRLRSLLVIDALPQVISWHENGLVPLGPELTADPRCRYVLGDFFALSAGEGFDPQEPNRRFHAILLDIDHSPRNLIHQQHAHFYSGKGLRNLANFLHPGGVFAMWSDDPPDDQFMFLLSETFPTTEATIVSFHNPLQDCESKSTVYLAQLASE